MASWDDAVADRAFKRRRSEIEAEARKSGGVVTSVSVGGAAANVASGEIEVPPSALVSQTSKGAPNA